MLSLIEDEDYRFDRINLFIDIINEFFGNRCFIDKTPELHDSDISYFVVNCVFYKNFKVFFRSRRGNLSIHLEVGRGSLPLSFLSSKKLKSKFDENTLNIHKNKSEILRNISNDLKILDEELRLRLPDKFLAQFD